MAREEEGTKGRSRLFSLSTSRSTAVQKYLLPYLTLCIMPGRHQPHHHHHHRECEKIMRNAYVDNAALEYYEVIYVLCHVLIHHIIIATGGKRAKRTRSSAALETREQIHHAATTLPRSFHNNIIISLFICISFHPLHTLIAQSNSNKNHRITTPPPPSSLHRCLVASRLQHVFIYMLEWCTVMVDDAPLGGGWWQLSRHDRNLLLSNTTYQQLQ